MCICSKHGKQIPCSLAFSGFPCYMCAKPEAFHKWANGKGFEHLIKEIQKRAKGDLVEPFAKALYRESTFGEADTTRWEDLLDGDRSYDFKGIMCIEEGRTSWREKARNIIEKVSEFPQGNPQLDRGQLSHRLSTGKLKKKPKR